ncbi:hypothetical protein BDY17DRAFT_323227 [Neohortaea acidophila]|uniref:Uncharacterized protein n=1 Tax=Neohortaea acidophila TaxID=245834 RepID=A0A6A6PW20_9PEZI|nr:uncharacterized protein BDY17DRAFT_323227 [Neohortaea acidophila]KAF2484368.1 hypothetical protein BDY17DRAFT_323227 [Neohortaea acidophila]
MDIFTLSSSAYLSLQGTTLLLTPSLLVSLTALEPRRPTDLETYLSRALGLTLIILALQILLHSNFLPSASSSSAAPSTSQDINPYDQPSLIVTTGYHALTAFHLYTQLTRNQSNFAFSLGCACSSLLFCLGMWTILFGGSQGRFSKTTGADKHTGNWPFGNAASAKAQKKEWKGQGRKEI